DVEKVEEAQQKFPQSKGDVTDAILQTVKALTRKEKQIEGEHEKAEAAQAAAKLPKEMQQKNEQLMKGKEKSHQEHGERLTEKMEKEKVQMREEQQRITEHMKQARLLQ
ncbi:Guanylate-binding protein 1, partial [Lemmus lemmus]